MENIKEYLNKQMSEQESDDFTRHLLQGRVNTRRKQRWEKIIEDQSTQPAITTSKNRIQRWRWSVGIAAAVALLLAALVYLVLPQNQESTPQALAEAFLQEVTPPSSGNIRKGSEGGAASEWYDFGAFDKAIPMFKENIRKGIAQPNEPLLLAIAQLYHGQPAQAIEGFDAIFQTQPVLARDNSDIINWYLSVAYIQTNDLEKARAQLLQIESGDWNYEEAQKWLSALTK